MRGDSETSPESSVGLDSSFALRQGKCAVVAAYTLANDRVTVYCSPNQASLSESLFQGSGYVAGRQDRYRCRICCCAGLHLKRGIGSGTPLSSNPLRTRSCLPLPHPWIF